MTTTVQVWRLEHIDDVNNNFKHYTLYLSSEGHAFFGYSRIGQNYSFVTKGKSASGAAIVQKWMQTKLREYDLVWKADLEIPVVWADNPAFFARQIQDATERARLEGRTAFGTDVDDEPKTPLGDLIVRCRNTVTKMADNPDSAVADYAALVAVHEGIATDLSAVESYIDTLRLMLAGAGRG